jgi:hypothetical protein
VFDLKTRPVLRGKPARTATLPLPAEEEIRPLGVISRSPPGSPISGEKAAARISAFVGDPSRDLAPGSGVPLYSPLVRKGVSGALRFGFPRSFSAESA